MNTLETHCSRGSGLRTKDAKVFIRRQLQSYKLAFSIYEVFINPFKRHSVFIMPS